MKKMTIALFTAAAMGASGIAVAADVTGPTLFGRVQVAATDTEGEPVELQNDDTKLGVTGGADNLVGGIDGYYSLRMDAQETADNGEFYTYVGVKGAFGDLRVGEDDDLAYKFAGVKTDVLRELGTAGPEATAGGLGDEDSNDEASAQYHYSFGNFTVAGYGQTSDAGVDAVQVGVHGDFGPAQIGIVHSDDDSSGDNTDAEIHVGATIDFGAATLVANTVDKRDDTNPYAIGAVVPLTDVWTATAVYGSDDADTEQSDVVGQIRANLGGGLAWNVSVRNGDSGDGVGTSLRFTF